jgi:predicted amidohydrolase
MLPDGIGTGGRARGRCYRRTTQDGRQDHGGAQDNDSAHVSERSGAVATRRVLLAQLAPHTHNVEANVAAACELVDRHPDADLAVLPELFVHAYALKGLVPLDLDATVALGPLRAVARARRTAVVVGVAERMGEAMANTALCIDERGAVAGRYRKVHLYGAERRFFVAGDEYVVVPLAGMAVGPLVCYDLEFPEAPRALAAAGAELLVTLSANMDPFAEDHQLFMRVRALENGVPHVYVNCVGQEGRLRFCGGSGVTDASGRVLAALPAYRSEVRVVDVPLSLPEGAAAPEYLSDRRPDVGARRSDRVVEAGERTRR